MGGQRGGEPEEVKRRKGWKRKKKRKRKDEARTGNLESERAGARQFEKG